MIILIIFVISIIILLIRNSFISLILAWEGLGFTSFLLVIFFNTSISWNGGIKTFLINRIGDSFLFLRIAFNFVYSGNFYIFLIAFFTKSAQFPFSSWLPAAIVAPTPVSALVHSSTLVTAGVYMIIRYNINLLDYKIFIIYSGLFTCILGAYSAYVETDIKKVVAFSTLRQIGFLTFSIFRKYIIYHLLTHAIFKALLFLVVGYFIIASLHNQDKRLFCNPLITNFFLSFVFFCRLFSIVGFFLADIIEKI